MEAKLEPKRQSHVQYILQLIYNYYICLMIRSPQVLNPENNKLAYNCNLKLVKMPLKSLIGLKPLA